MNPLICNISKLVLSLTALLERRSPTRLVGCNISRLVLSLAAAVPLRAATLLLNPGFESGPAGPTTAIPGWPSYGSNTYCETNAALAHSGTNYFKVYQAFNGSVNSNGIYQDYISGPGAVYAADGWAYTATSDTLAGQNAAWIEVSFRDANANVLAL